eukprot:XP_001707779.1 Hypothetical protein GL50803_38554 [Giardia lamblia ATCC 50803]
MPCEMGLPRKPSVNELDAGVSDCYDGIAWRYVAPHHCRRDRAFFTYTEIRR